MSTDHAHAVYPNLYSTRAESTAPHQGGSPNYLERSPPPRGTVEGHHQRRERHYRPVRRSKNRRLDSLFARRRQRFSGH